MLLSILYFVILNIVIFDKLIMLVGCFLSIYVGTGFFRKS